MKQLIRWIRKLFWREWTLAIWVKNETGKWQHLAIVRRLNKTTLYINGKESRVHQGLLEGLMVFDCKLKPNEVVALYKHQAPESI